MYKVQVNFIVDFVLEVGYIKNKYSNIDLPTAYLKKEILQNCECPIVHSKYVQLLETGKTDSAHNMKLSI